MFGRCENEERLPHIKQHIREAITPYKEGLERAVKFAVKWDVLEVDHLTLLGMVPDIDAWTGGVLGEGGLAADFWSQYQLRFGEKQPGRNIWRFLGQPASGPTKRILPQRGTAWREKMIRAVARELGLPLHKVHGEKDFTIAAGDKAASQKFKEALTSPCIDLRIWKLIDKMFP